MKGKEGREEEAHVEGGVEDKGSSECVLDPDTSRAPKFSRAIPDATPGDRATHTILPPPSSNSPLEKSSFLEIPRRGKFFSNLSPFSFHSSLLSDRNRFRHVSFQFRFVSSGIVDRHRRRIPPVPRFTITKRIRRDLVAEK